MFSARVARLVAGKVGYTVSFGTAKALGSLPAQHVKVLLGTGSTVVPAGLTPASSSTSTPSPSASAAAAAADNGAAGGPVTVAPNAKYGIPCVY
jgi:hypothetical protein